MYNAVNFVKFPISGGMLPDTSFFKKPLYHYKTLRINMNKCESIWNSYN